MLFLLLKKFLFKPVKAAVAAREEAVAKEYRDAEEAKAAARYQGQLDAYSLALSRIFETPVEKKLLYFFATDAIVAV